MTTRALPLMPLAATLVALISTACTGGQVTKNGAVVAGTNVEILTCNVEGPDYQTVTDASGVYQFNPFSPNSPVIDSSNYIPEGPIAIAVTGVQGSSITRRMHQYDETCAITYNGTNQDLPCKIQSIQLVPMDPAEFWVELSDFHLEDCNLGGLVAEQRTRQAFSFVAESGDGFGEPSEVSCLTDCASSCSPGGLLSPAMLKGDLPDDLASCMCSCANVSCGTELTSYCSGDGQT